MKKSLYKKAVLYVMSGTGNTYRLGRWMAEMAGPHGCLARVVMIDDPASEKPLDPSDDLLVGILFPAHGFMPPWSMIKFLFRMKPKRGVRAFCAATRGGIRVGPVFIPGVAGFGTFLAALILLCKGYRPTALFSLDMPSNFINFHWGLHRKNVEAIGRRCQDRLARLFPRILQGQRILFTRNNLWEAMWSVLILAWVPLFPLMYLLIGRLFMAKIMFANDRCNGCELCARYCPNQAIVMKEVGGKVRPYWSYHCETCLRCMGFCSRKAVEAGHSWGVLLYFILSIPVITFLLGRLHRVFHIVPVTEDAWLGSLVNLFYLWPALFLAYVMFWYLVQLPVLNRFFTLTTLTHYYRRYHDPDTKLQDLKKTL